MKIVVWHAITDGGDGEHHLYTYKSKVDMVEDLGLEIDYEDSSGGFAFDKCNSPVEFSRSIFDTTGYEVVEE